MKNAILLFFSILMLNLSAQDIQIRGFHDGDSPKVLFKADSTIMFVRIVGIDAPEVFSPYVTGNQTFGAESGNNMRVIFKGKEAKISLYGTDHYNRYLAQIFVDGKDIAETALREGWAWYVASSKLPKKVRGKYKELEKEARANKRGLWANKNPMNPATFRKRNPPIKVP